MKKRHHIQVMYIERKFLKNYLTRRKNEYGVLSALFFIASCLIVSHIYWFNTFHISEYLSANSQQVFQNGEYWRLFTTTLVHGDIKHLLANSLMLFILLYFVTSFFGVIASLLLSFIMGGVINAFTLSFYAPEVSLVGASGVLYYLWGFWLVLYLGIETHRSIFGRLVRVFGVFFILLVPTSLEPTTSYLAHYSGFGFGVIIGAFYFLFNRSKFKRHEIWEEKIIEEEEDEVFSAENILH